MQVSAELLGVQDASLFVLVEAPGLLSVEITVAKVEGAAWLGERYLLVAALADDLDVLELFIVDDLVETAAPLINENISTSLSLNNVFHPPRA